jgi:hypothetical protein
MKLTRMRMQRRGGGTRRANVTLGCLLEHTDVATLIVQRMNAYEALVCSMTCRRLRSLVDRYATNAFQTNLQMRLWSPVQKMPMPCEIHERYGYLHFEYHVRAEDWYKIAKTCTSQRGSTVPLVCVFQIPLENLVCSEVSSAARRRNTVSVEVAEWKLADASRVEPWNKLADARLEWLASVTRKHRLVLQARKFCVLDTGVKAHLARALVLTVHGAPLLRSMTPRARFVFNNVHNCMHCHQRKRAVETLDGTRPELAVLCTTCWQELFVTLAHLKSRYKAHTIRQYEASLAACDVVHYTSSKHEYSMFTSSPPRKHTTCVLKSELASAFACASWEHFLRARHLRAKTTALPQQRFKYKPNACSA